MNAEAIRTQVRKMISSRAMARSERLARFLEFTVGETLAGHADQLKEFVVGVEVFDRKQDYDPRLDPIVRVEARRLRMKLRRYYETEGIEDRLRIEYPKGSYAPSIRMERGTVTSREAQRAIAVLPFASGNEQCEYLTDGLTEEVIDALMKAGGLRVVAFNSSRKWKSAPHDYSRIADALKVDVVLEGSARAFAPGQMRIAVQLVSVRDNSYLWTGTFERPFEDVFSVRDAIAAGVARALNARPAAPSTFQPSLEAYHFYLRGRYYWNKRTEESVARGAELLERAIAADPNYALAYAGLADCHIVLAKFGAAPAREAMPKAREAARRARDLDPTLAEAHVALGSIASLFDWDWASAEQHFRRGLELNPAYATGHQWYAHDFLSGVGRISEAEAALDRARACDPLSLVVLASSGENMIMQRRPAAALDYYARALDLDPYFPRAHFGLARALVALHRHDEAVIAVRKGSALTPESAMALALEANVCALAGRIAEARETAESLERNARERRVAPYLLMRAWMALDADRACGYLEEAFEERDPRLVHLAVSPVYDSLRGMTRFEAVVRGMGLAAESVVTLI